MGRVAALWFLLVCGVLALILAALLLPPILRAVLYGHGHAPWAWLPLGLTVLYGVWGAAATVVAARRLLRGGAR